MKKEKLSLKSIKNVLSREELKKIMAGSTGECSFCGPGGYTCCGCYDTYPYSSYALYGVACANDTCNAHCISVGLLGGNPVDCSECLHH